MKCKHGGGDHNKHHNPCNKRSVDVHNDDEQLPCAHSGDYGDDDKHALYGVAYDGDDAQPFCIHAPSYDGNACALWHRAFHDRDHVPFRGHVLYLARIIAQPTLRSKGSLQ